MKPGLMLLVLYAFSTLAQWAMWRWMNRVAPTFLARHQKALVAVLGLLFVLPIVRELSWVFPVIPHWPALNAFALIWHITLWLSMATIGLAYAGRRLLRTLRARRDPRPTVVPDPAPSSIERRRALECIGGTAAFAASGSVLAWGTLRGRFEWSIEEVPVRLARLPKALDGFTIVQISDLHIGPFVGERELARGLALVARARPDLVVITGDIIDSDPTFIPLAAEKLGALRAREGVVCIPGNHDYFTGVGSVLAGMHQAGIEVLLNRGKVIAPSDGGFALLGVADLRAKAARREAEPDLDRALRMVPSSELATVLLAHQPQFVETAAKARIDLQLSGHTHGGQVNPILRPIDLFYRYVAGLYRVGPTQLYVNRGFGTSGPPTRVGAPPEITKLVLTA